MCSLLFNFWKSLRRISVSCLNVWHLNLFTSEVIQSRDFFVRRFLITDSISLLFIGLFRFSNIFMFCISINLSILPRLSSLSLFFFFFFFVQNCLQYSYNSFYFCKIDSICECVSHSVVSDSVTPWTVQPTRLLCPWNSPDKNTGVSSYSLLQGIFPSQESNPDLLHCRQILYHLSHQGSTQIGSSAPIFISYFSIFILSPFSQSIELKICQFLKSFQRIDF